MKSWRSYLREVRSGLVGRVKGNTMKPDKTTDARSGRGDTPGDLELFDQASHEAMLAYESAEGEEKELRAELGRAMARAEAAEVRRLGAFGRVLGLLASRADEAAVLLIQKLIHNLRIYAAPTAGAFVQALNAETLADDDAIDLDEAFREERSSEAGKDG